MIALDPILDFLNICVWTSVLKNESPVSVVVVAESSSGKSAMLRKLQCPLTIFLTDVTVRDISKVMQDRTKRIILLSDMQAIFSHKNTVVSMTSQALRNLLEEGIYNDPFSGEPVERRFGMISAIPPDEFQKVNRTFVSGGLNTRFLILEYAYRLQTVAKIHDSIEHGVNVRDEPLEHVLPQDAEYKVIRLPAPVAKKCRNLASEWKRENTGLRVHHQIRSLVMAVAARNGRKSATMKDYELIESFSDFLDPRIETKVSL